MYKNRSQGFTLIELLVVIAIIGILSAVVLASLNSARSKGSDAAIKSNLDTIRTQSAIYADTPGKGDGVYYSVGNTTSVNTATANACATPNTLFTDANVALAIQAADRASGGAGNATPTNVTCTNDGGGSARMRNWAIAVKLINVPGTYYCVDSRGVASTTGIAAPTLAALCG